MSGQALSLYRAMMREATKVNVRDPRPPRAAPATRDRRPLPPQQYNFRHYAVRRVREDFRKNASLTGAEATAAIKRGHVDLQVLRRQQIVGNLYPAAMSVMDAPAAKR